MTKQLLILLLVVSLHLTAYADSWYFPRERARAAASENEKFVAYVTPAKQKEKPLLEVFQIEDSNELPLWQCRLGNLGSPWEVFISDNGRYVVTVNEGGMVGYGDHVLAFYDANGPIANYSMEQVLNLPKNIGLTELYKLELYKLIPHSTSSRWWDKYSVKFFGNHRGVLYFCIWLDLFDRWSAWNPTDGKELKVDPSTAKKWTAKARLWAIKKIKGKSQGFPNWLTEAIPYVFLTKLRKPDDRKFIEQLLSHELFDTYRPSTISGFLHYSQASLRRSLAEQLLARWDGRLAESNHFNPHSGQIYHYLGIVDGIVRLPQAPKLGDGTLWVYLVLAEVPEHQWQNKPPLQLLHATFDDSLFDDYSPKISKHFLFGIKGVTPGKYRLKAVWDKAKPHCEYWDKICLPSAGDFQSIHSQVVTVKPGQVTNNIIIDCTHKLADESN